jgi:hypothetical protein
VSDFELTKPRTAERYKGADQTAYNATPRKHTNLRISSYCKGRCLLQQVPGDDSVDEAAKTLRTNTNRSSRGWRSSTKPSLPPKRALLSRPGSKGVAPSDDRGTLPRARLGTALRTNWEPALHLVTSPEKARHTRHNAATHGGPRKRRSLGLIVDEEDTKQARPAGHQNQDQPLLRRTWAHAAVTTPLSPGRGTLPLPSRLEDASN